MTTIPALLSDVLGGHRLTGEEAARLLRTRAGTSGKSLRRPMR